MMIELDGSYGEGGGAILRQALALSIHTGKGFKIDNIRANRPQPGLKMQHLQALNASQRLCNAEVSGNFEGSTEVTFIPDNIKPQSMKIDIGTAGSITLLLQSLMLPCIFSTGKFKFEITGGTDVKWSQPIDYFVNVLLPQFRKYAQIEVEIIRRGYYPKGDGRIKISIAGNGEPSRPIELLEKKELLQVKGVSHASSDLEENQVAERQAKTAEHVLGIKPTNIRVEYVRTSGTGSGITLWAMYGDDEGIDVANPVILGGDALGEPRKKAELVGEEAALALKSELNGVADKYLADQLIPFMAMAKGKIKTSKITEHARSNIYVAEKFADLKFKVSDNTISV